jgi:hypothetical protein
VMTPAPSTTKSAHSSTETLELRNQEAAATGHGTSDTASRAAAIVNNESTITSPSGEGGRLHLCQGTRRQFIADAVQARVANRRAERFSHSRIILTREPS